MSPTPAQVAAPVMEVFASFQGEGLYVGQPQVFLRLAGCPLRCRWCDTPGSWATRMDRDARIDAPSGSLREPRVASPFQAALWVASVEPGEPRTVSVTGGEPLMWPEFIRALRSMVAPRRLHLETAGGHPEALARVLDRIDHVSLDLKLPADMGEPVELQSADGEPASIDEPAPATADDWRMARRRCLDLLQDRDACAKVVVSADRESRDYDELFEDVARRAPGLPVFIAPVTPIGGCVAPPLDQLIEVVEHARELDLDVRVLPQVHRAMGIA
ncbi:MAG: 7-carboxy-7-deazaguanine synthase QueE [Planctomycetota bacterium]|nr:7-carboxy-7-deazaguanine synthase QueE [Planctomycetota bacterium]MDG1984716.1 7-carboxy-7-deazaguanine synthase QueE [Planctomycetota bacterium]